MLIKNTIRKSLFLAAALSIAGCAAPPVKKAERYFWPRLPDRPRVEWLNAYHDQDDLDDSKGGLLEVLTGDQSTFTLENPTEIAAAKKSNRFYVADPNAFNVAVFDKEKKKVYYLVDKESDIKLEMPTSVVLDDDDNVYVGDTSKRIIYVFNSKHKLLRQINVAPDLVNTGGLDIDMKNKRIVVADPKGHKLCFIGLDGKFQKCVGKRGDKDGSFNYPNSVKINGKGEIIVGDTMNARIQIFDLDGKFLRKFGERGDGLGNFQVLKGVALDSENNIYVSDGKAHRINIFSENGDFLMAFGGRFSIDISGKVGQGGFLVPQGIFFYQDDRFLVVDQMNRRIQEFRYISDKYLNANPIDGISIKKVIGAKDDKKQ